MVESSVNGTTVTAPAMPTVVHLSAADSNRIPSPGTLRMLKAQLGKSWAELMGPDADDADRFQTLAWVALRRDRPELRWEDCEDVELVIEDVPAVPDPFDSASSATSPSSAASGA
jgi:hypothetical protein